MHIEDGSLAIFWLGQAGFVLKSPSGPVVYIDPYWSDAVERVFGFQRRMACPMRPEDAGADLVLCTHEHLDHMDIDALPVIARNPRTRFSGPVECLKAFAELGIPAARCHLLEPGVRLSLAGLHVSGVYADHGELAPDAIGIVIEYDGVTLYHTGDTAYRPQAFAPAIAMRPDVLLPCINGRYGNMTEAEAALLVRDSGATLAIASHYGMFTEHNGDAASFLEQCARLAPTARAVALEPGGYCTFRRRTGARL